MTDEEKARLVFEEFMIWPVSHEPIPIEQIVDGLLEPDRRFITAVWRIAEPLYPPTEQRKNGDPLSVHPTHVAWYLKRAQCQPYVIACGLLHDYIEDRVERDYGKVADPVVMDTLGAKLRGELGVEVIKAATEAGFPRDPAERVVEIVWTLTRHKADLYYKSISAIFNHEDLLIRLPAAMVKLADRMHNIQTIENYKDSDKLYQCFKNIFILNNAKQLRIATESRGRAVDKRMVNSLAKLNKKCGKATFQALMGLQYEISSADRFFDLLTYLALALKKFSLEIGGLWRVAHPDLALGAPIYNLYHGIVEKYDHLLHHEEPEYLGCVERELRFVAGTFQMLRLTEEELKRAIAAKDAMVLAEVVASLLYQDTFVIKGFECGSLCRRNKQCLRLGPRLASAGGPSG